MLSTIMFHTAETAEEVRLTGNMGGRDESAVVGAVLFAETMRNPKRFRRDKYAEGREEVTRNQTGTVRDDTVRAKVQHDTDAHYISRALSGVYGANVAEGQADAIRRCAKRACSAPKYAKDCDRVARVEVQGRMRDVAEEVAAETVAHICENAHKLTDMGSWTRTRYHLPETSSYLQCVHFVVLPKAIQTVLLANAKGKKKALWSRAEEVVERFAGDCGARFDSKHKPHRATIGTYSAYQGIETEGNQKIKQSELVPLVESGLVHITRTKSEPSHLLGYAKRYARNYSRKLMSLYTMGREESIVCPEGEEVHGFTHWDTQDHTILDSEQLILCANQFLRYNNPRMNETSRRAILLLLTGEGFTYREVGAAIGVSEGTVKVLAHRYLTQVREHVGHIMLNSAVS